MSDTELFPLTKLASCLHIGMPMSLLITASGNYFQIRAAFVMTFLKEFLFVKYLPYLKKLKIKSSILMLLYLGNIWERVQIKVSLNCNNIWKIFNSHPVWNTSLHYPADPGVSSCSPLCFLSSGVWTLSPGHTEPC